MSDSELTYLILTSSSTTCLPGANGGYFKTILQPPLILAGQWEVCVDQASFKTVVANENNAIFIFTDSSLVDSSYIAGQLNPLLLKTQPMPPAGLQMYNLIQTLIPWKRCKPDTVVSTIGIQLIDSNNNDIDLTGITSISLVFRKIR